MGVNGLDSYGRKHGIWRIWNTNKSIVTLAYYYHGILDGPVQTITYRGYIKKEQYYCNGQKHGKFTKWKWANAPYTQTYYHHGKQVGLTRTWQEGTTCGEYDDDCDCDACGSCSYSDCGRSERSDYMICDNNNDPLHKYVIDTIGYMNEGKKEGPFQSFNQYSQISEYQNYQGGLEHGKSIHYMYGYGYREDIYSYIQYWNGKKHGIEMLNGADGHMKECQYYVKGEKEGLVQDMANNYVSGMYDTRYEKHGLYRVWDTKGNIRQIVYNNFRCTNGLDQTFYDFSLVKETNNVVPNDLLERYPHLVQKLYGVDFI
jgi:hypothetical protein